MKIAIVFLLFSLVITGCSTSQSNQDKISNKKTSLIQDKPNLSEDKLGENIEDRKEDGEQSMILNLQANNQNFTIELLENETTRELIKKLPMTINMGDMNDNEKYYYISESLPTNSQSIRTIHRGDFMLYGSDCLVLFYETFSTNYTYTRLGSIQDTNRLKEVLSEGNIEVTLSVK